MNASAGFLDSLPIVLVFVGTVIFIIAFFEVGFRFGRYSQSRNSKGGDGSLGPMVGSTLAMLAFVLAITFSMAASRYDQRNQNLLDEVNAIESAYRRAGLLAEPNRSAMRQHLVEYVDLRVSSLNRGGREQALARSLEIHDLLWTDVTSAVSKNPSRVSTMLVQSVSDVISTHESRITSAVRRRIPPEIWFALYAIAAFAMISVGAQSGLSRTRRLMQVIPTALGFAMLITLIVDLDRPVDLGQVKVNQAAMIDLRNKMGPATE
jgi:hypothetical protein